MRIWPAILICVELCLPIYGQAKAGHSEADDTHTRQNSTPSVAVTVNCPSSPVQQEHPAEKSNGTDNKPEGYFKTLIAPNNIATVVLVLVGLGGIFVAVWTLRTIKRQVETFVSKERARVTVDIKPIRRKSDSAGRILYDKSPMPHPKDDVWDVDLLILNSGATNAFIGHALCKACIKPAGWNPQTESITSQIGLPKVMRPHSEGFMHSARIETGSALRQVDSEMAQGIEGGALGIYVIGHIEFRDVFDNRWAIKFCRKWGGWWFGGMWKENAAWYDYPEKSEMNGEFRIMRPSLLRRMWRRIRKRDPDLPVVEVSD